AGGRGGSGPRRRGSLDRGACRRGEALPPARAGLRASGFRSPVLAAGRIAGALLIPLLLLHALRRLPGIGYGPKGVEEAVDAAPRFQGQVGKESQLRGGAKPERPPQPRAEVARRGGQRAERIVPFRIGPQNRNVDAR